LLLRGDYVGRRRKLAAWLVDGASSRPGLVDGAGSDLVDRREVRPDLVAQRHEGPDLVDRRRKVDLISSISGASLGPVGRRREAEVYCSAA
jgi:hypothetical protein